MANSTDHKSVAIKNNRLKKDKPLTDQQILNHWKKIYGTLSQILTSQFMPVEEDSQYMNANEELKFPIPDTLNNESSLQMISEMLQLAADSSQNTEEKKNLIPVKETLGFLSRWNALLKNEQVRNGYTKEQMLDCKSIMTSLSRDILFFLLTLLQNYGSDLLYLNPGLFSDLLLHYFLTTTELEIKQLVNEYLIQLIRLQISFDQKTYLRMVKSLLSEIETSDSFDNQSSYKVLSLLIETQKLEKPLFEKLSLSVINSCMSLLKKSLLSTVQQYQLSQYFQLLQSMVDYFPSDCNYILPVAIRIYESGLLTQSKIVKEAAQKGIDQVLQKIHVQLPALNGSFPPVEKAEEKKIRAFDISDFSSVPVTKKLKIEQVIEEPVLQSIPELNLKPLLPQLETTEQPVEEAVVEEAVEFDEDLEIVDQELIE